MKNEKRKKEPLITWDRKIALCITLLCNGLAYYGTRLWTGGRYHYDLTNPLDRRIPVIPEAILVYWGCYGYWAVNYLLGCRQKKEEAYRFLSADCLAKLVCLLLFLLFPTTNVRPVITEQGIFWKLLGLLYAVDAADNLFPSIHCLTSWFCYIAVRGNRAVPRAYRVFSLGFTLLVCASTLVTKQHVLPDVFGGILLAEGSYRLVGRTGFCRGYGRCVEKIEQRIRKAD